MSETIVTGKKYRILTDVAQKVWQRVSFWTKSSDVEFNDGKTAETKVGAISGITDSLVSTSSNIAASAKAVSELNGNLNVYVDEEGKLHFVNGSGADSVLNFNSGVQSYTFRLVHEQTASYSSASVFLENISRLIVTVSCDNSNPQFIIYENGSMKYQVDGNFSEREFPVSKDKVYRLYTSPRITGDNVSVYATVYF